MQNKKRKTLLPALFAFLMLVISACTISSGAISYKPQNGKGPVVIMLAGRAGTASCAGFAEELQNSGYYVVLFDSNMLVRDPDTSRKLSEEIDKALQSPFALTRKATVVGYSLGGGLALQYASQMPERVSNIIAYYPSTAFIKDIDSFADSIKVPVVVFQGEQDKLLCCTIGRIQEIHRAATAKEKRFELVVYPDAGHAFNRHVSGSIYLRKYDEDSWQKTLKTIKKYNP